MAQDGLNTLQFKLVEKKPLPLGGGQSLPNILHYMVDQGAPEASAA